MNPPTHPMVFVRFVIRKGEIWVKNFGGVLRGSDLVWESATPPTHIWETFPPKNVRLVYTRYIDGDLLTADKSVFFNKLAIAKIYFLKLLKNY